jgi:excisionase family DNA binding protein
MATHDDKKTQLPTLMTVDEVGELFRISKNSVYRMTQSGMLQYYKIGGSMRFDKADMMIFLESVKHKPWNEKFYVEPNKSH